MRSDNYNEYNCDELGISNLASVGDVSEGLLDLLAPDENDANIVQLGVRTATEDCVCKLPKKRCGDIQARSGLGEEEDEERGHGGARTRRSTLAGGGGCGGQRAIIGPRLHAKLRSMWNWHW